MAKRHLLVLPKAARFYDRKDITIDDVTFTFNLYTYGNASGFVHFAEMFTDNGYKHVFNGEEIAHAKAQYYNRTWERFEGQSVYRECVDFALKSNDITQRQAELLKEALR